MTTISDRDRAEAQAMFEAYHAPRGALAALSGYHVRRWLAVRDHVLASYTPDSASGQARVLAWDDIAKHPFFADCYPTDGTLVEAMLAKLDAAHTHECEPVWRPVAAAEVQAGWEVRSRGRSGIEMNWGIAHHRDLDGDWRTEAGAVLTAFTLSWTYETTAPLPEPWDEALVGVVSDALAGTEDPGPHWVDDARRVLDALAARGYLDRAAITGGERS